MSWTPERTETLKALWAEGLSASTIAARLADHAQCRDRQVWITVIIGAAIAAVFLVPEQLWNLQPR